MSPEVSQDPATHLDCPSRALPTTLLGHHGVPRASVPARPHYPCPLTKPLPMTRQSPLRESQSLLVKWNCASWELRNRGPRVVWGRHGGSRVRAGQVLMAGVGGHARMGSHQQLLWDQLHDQLLRPLVSLPAGGEGQGGAPPPPPTLAPCPHSQVLPLVHVGLAGKGPLQLRGGVRVGSALLWWGQRGLWTRPSCAGWLPLCGSPESAPTPQTPRVLAAGTHLLPLQDATPGQQLVAEPVLTDGQAPEGESGRGGSDGAQGPKDPSTLLWEGGK